MKTTVNYGAGESLYGPDMPLVDVASIGRVAFSHPVTGRLDGTLLNQARSFNDAYCVNGGSRWGVSTCPRPGDIVGLWWDTNGQAFATPISMNYGALVSKGDAELADNGFTRIDGGEVHTHSFGHAESYLDNIGNWMAYNGMGDYIHLDAIDGEYRLKASQAKLEEIGYREDGLPGVVLRAGMQAGIFDENTPGVLTPKKSEWHLQVNNKVWIDVSEDAEGNVVIQGPDNGGVNTALFIDSSGVVVQGAAIQVVGTASVNVQSDNITHNLGTEPIVLGTQFAAFANQLITLIEAITVPTAMGPSGIPLNIPAFEILRNQYLTPTGNPPAPLLLSDKSKVAK